MRKWRAFTESLDSTRSREAIAWCSTSESSTRERRWSETSYADTVGTVWQFVGILLLIGIIGAYFWPIALTLAAAYLSYRVVLRVLVTRDQSACNWSG